MKSRMLGNSHVRFGEGDEKTCPGNGARRLIPTPPATVGLFENVVGQTLHGLADADGRTLRFGLIPDGFGDLDRRGGHGDLIVAGLGFDILDLAGVGVAVEADDDTRDAGERQSTEQRALVQGEHFGLELGLGDRLHLPVGEGRSGLGGSSGCVGHDGLLK